MDPHALLLFLHILGGIGLFVGLGIEAVALRRLRRASGTDQTRLWMGVMREGTRIGPVAMVTLLVAGVWMMALRCGPDPWIVTAIVALVAVAVLGAAITRRTVARLEAELAERRSSLRQGPGARVR